MPYFCHLEAPSEGWATAIGTIFMPSWPSQADLIFAIWYTVFKPKWVFPTFYSHYTVCLFIVCHYVFMAQKHVALFRFLYFYSTYVLYRWRNWQHIVRVSYTHFGLEPKSMRIKSARQSLKWCYRKYRIYLLSINSTRNLHSTQIQLGTTCLPDDPVFRFINMWD